jgi:NAD(P)-dependent dehydrogenase (short-subunit alcohol dehydrogenase family)
MGRVEGKIAIVTGGAAGIGEACGRALAREGAKVIFTDIQDARGQIVADSICADGGEAIYLHQDVTSEEEWQGIVSHAVSEFGGLDILVNNAGIGTGGPVTEMTLEDFRTMMAINVEGVFLGTKHAVPAMAQTGGGSIVIISSVAGMKGAPGLSAYAASKGAVRLFSKSVAIECARGGTNVRVNSVHPGIIDTEIWQQIASSGLAEDSPILAAAAGSNVSIASTVAEVAGVPIGHAADPLEIANGVLFLASDESKYMTGTELVIDGGMCA